MKFAYEIWSEFNHGDEQLKGVFIDEFDSTDYCAQEFGDWGSCWVETNDDNAATSGDIQIAANVVSMRSGSKQISRAMNLQHVDQAWLSFNRRRDNLDHLGDFIDVDVLPDAGQTWHLLDHFVGEATDLGLHRGSYYDISQYATAATRIRLISSSQMGENDWLFFDNVKVNSWDSSAASQAAPIYGELLLDENWQVVDTPTTDSPPAVFMGVATDSAGGAGVAAVRNGGTDHLEVQLQELAQAGGDVSAERVSYLALQTGTYVMPDGSHWEVGAFDIGADGTWQSQVFKTPFADRPFLFISLQTANNAVIPVLQVRTVDAAGFEVSLFEQVTSGSPGLNETPFQATFTITVTGSVVPDVVGMSHAEAEDRIRLAGLAVGDVEEEETAAVPEGQVLRQSPAPASNVPSLTLVDLVIASAVAVSDGSSGDSVSGSGGGGCSVVRSMAWIRFCRS
jgi:hypothetical protein